MYTEYHLGSGELLPIVSETCNIYYFSENGQDILELKRGETFIPPLFEIAADIEIYTPGEKEPNLHQIAKSISSIHQCLDNMRNKLYSTYNCRMAMSTVRTDWTSIPSYGPPKGPIECVNTIRELISVAQSHNCSKRKIASFDDPIKRMVGLCCLCGRRWQMDLVNIKKGVDSGEDKEMISLLKTSEGRNRLAEAVDTMQAIPEIKLNEKMDPGDGIEPFSIAYFSNRSLFGWDGEMHNISFQAPSVARS